MSFHALAWATRQKLPSTQKLVLIMLAERHNWDTGRCDPSHDSLAEDCGLSRRSVMEQIRRLAEAGYIRVLHRAKDNAKLSNLYVLNLHFGIQEEVKAPVDPHVISADPNGGSERDSLGVVNVVHQGGEPGAHKPGIEPKKLNLSLRAGDMSGTRFDEFWAAYPVKTEKRQCAARWLPGNLDMHVDVILADIAAKREHDRRWLGGYVSGPLVYLNQERWNDPVQPVARGGPVDGSSAYSNPSSPHSGKPYATTQSRESLVDRAARKLEEIGVLHQ